MHPTYRVEYDIQAFAVDPNDPDLGQGHPWAFKLTDVATRTYAFWVDTSHDLYRSSTMTPLDALLTELSFRTGEFLKQTAPEATLPSILADFRREYCVDSRLDAADIIMEATGVLTQIAQSLTLHLSDGQGRALYEGLTEAEKSYIGRKMIARGVTFSRRTSAIAAGSISRPTRNRRLVPRVLLAAHPELFFDGRFWEDPYAATLDYGVIRNDG